MRYNASFSRLVSAPGALARRAALAAFLAAALLVAGVPQQQEARAQVSGISYTLSPVGKYAAFGRDNDSGLDNALLYGGELGFGFGQYLEVSAVYLRRNGVENTFEEGNDDDDIAALGGLADDRETDLQQYGGRVRLNLGTFDGDNAGFVPFVAGGAGLLRFDPDGVDASESIYVTGGAGATFSAFDRYTLTLEGQALSYRYNPATTFFTPGELGGLTTEQQDLFVPSARASLQVYLGGRDPDDISDLDRAFREQFSGGLSGVRFFVEPFYGRIEFADELKNGGGGQFYRDQNVAGVNAGINLGPYVGLRGFYWRGASGQEDVFDDFAGSFEPIAFYGGELNLRFGTSALGARSFTPYGIVGGGYVDVLSDYQDEIDGGTSLPNDRYFGTLGGGLEVPLSDNIKLQGDVRSLFMSTQQVEDVSDPDQVHANLMYSAGIEIAIGGGGGPTPEELMQRRAEQRGQALREETRADLDATEQALLDELQRLQTRIDSLEQRGRRDQMQRQQQEELEALEEDLSQQGLSEEEVRAIIEEQQAAQQQRDPQQQPAEQDDAGRASGLSDRVIELPVPEVGEIYVRIGEQAGGGGGGGTNVETSYAPPTIVTPLQGGGGAQQAAPQQAAPQQAAPQQQGRQGAAAAGALSREDISTIISEELRQARQEQALSREDITRIVEQTVQQELAAAGDTDAAMRNAQIRRLEDRIGDLRDDLDDELSDLERRQLLSERFEGSGNREIIIEEGDDGETTVTETSGGGGGGLAGVYAPSRLTPMAGFSFGGAERFLLGVRGNYGGGYGGLGSSAGFRFMPEAAIGFGDGVGISLIANGVYDFDEGLFGGYLPDGLGPYAGGGVGLTTETGLGINLLGGMEYETGRGEVFAEYSTMDFFDYNRVLIGYRARF